MLIKKWLRSVSYALLFIPLCALARQAAPDLPAHMQNIQADAIQQMTISNEQLLVHNEGSNTWTFELPFLSSPDKIQVNNATKNRSGTFSFSSSFQRGAESWQVLFTQGERVGFGEMIGDNKRLIIEQRGNDVVVVNVGLSGLAPGIYDGDVVGDISGLPLQNNQNIQELEEFVVVDLMLLFTQNIVDTFPGEMTQALLEHLVFKANLAFVDSFINVRLRLVHTEFVDFQDPSNFTALSQLSDVLDNNPNTPAVDSLQQVADLREQFGADLVAMIRTHNLNERDVCGVARFPDPNSDVLINISNVGISGGSNCLDTFTHEIGHNFGAQHQRINDQPQGPTAFAGALVVNDKFNTVMSSIGTGDINRDFGLPVFSNPDLVCGGITCGDPLVSDNARVVNGAASTNAGLRASVVQTTVPNITPSEVDRDGDGVLDVDDAFPFNPNEVADTDLDGVGDNADDFIDNANEQFDTDLDGIGNNADTDDDNDGTPDVNDALPLDPNDTVDADSDGIGPSNDELDNDFQETLDFDSDGFGDRNDLDDDNDGVADFSMPTSMEVSEAWVASAGNDRILRFDQSGNFIEPLLQVGAGGLTFRSDMVLSQSQQLFFIAFSDVLQFDRQTETTRIAIDRSQLNTFFPLHLAFQSASTLFVSNGLLPVSFQSFNLSNSGNLLTSTTLAVDQFIRDFVILDGNIIMSVARDVDSFVAFDLTVRSEELIETQGLNTPENIVLDSNGDLLVTNVGSGNITRYDARGSFLGEFIGAGSGGLGTPSCITVGPDGNIYICSRDTDQVLRYDGDTGAFIDVFIEAGDGELSQPVNLVFAGTPLDEFRLDGDHDSDGDSVNNIDDAFPLDATETTDTDNDGTGNNADTDDDNDGLPDTYEIDNNFDPLDSTDAQEDADNDGSTNFQEFQAGTNPNDANSTPTPPPPPPVEPSSSGGGSIYYLLFLSGLGLFFKRCRAYSV
jgi:hypothetical protein